MTTRMRSILSRLDDEDARVLLLSWTVALAAGASWLAIVHLAAPPADPVNPVAVARDSIVIGEHAPMKYGDEEPEGRRDATRPAPTPASNGRITARDVANAFGEAMARRPAAAVLSVIHGVDALRAKIGPTVVAPKSAIDLGSASSGTGALARGASAEAGRAVARVGVVRGGAIEAAQIRLRGLPVVTAPEVGAPGIDASEAASFVRQRTSQLQYCYEHTRQTEAPDLAGAVTLSLTMGARGTVREAAITRRSWSGQSAEVVERCLVNAARGWLLPSATPGATLSMSISFTHAAARR